MPNVIYFVSGVNKTFSLLTLMLQNVGLFFVFGVCNYFLDAKGYKYHRAPCSILLFGNSLVLAEVLLVVSGING